MYPAVLTLHSWLRWGALLLGVAATLDAVKDPAPPSTRLFGRSWESLLMLAIDCQVLLGLVLYVGLSPFTRQAMAQMSVALRNPQLRFWSVVHIAWMFGAFVLVRAGRILGLAPERAARRQRGRAICFALATVAMAAGTPWPGTTAARPLLRWWW